MAKTIIIKITQGNINSNYFTISKAVKEDPNFFPKDSFGGRDKLESGEPITVFFEGLPGSIETDIDTTKNIFRARGAVASFYKHHDLSEYDTVRITKESERQFKVYVKKALSEKIKKQITEDIESQKYENTSFQEGGKKEKFTTYYERDPKLKIAAIQCRNAIVCEICEFDFEKMYGERGEGYIEAHHNKPVSKMIPDTEVDPKEDITLVCSNCHRMIHRKKNHVLTPEELKEMLKKS